MECKHCGASLEDGQTVCPACGEAQTDAPQAEAAPVTAAEAPAAPEENAPETPSETPETSEAPSETPEKKPGRTDKHAIWLLGALVAAVAAVIVILIVSLTGKKPEETPAEPAADPGVSASEPADSPAPAETPEPDAPAKADPTDIEHVDAQGNFVAHSYTKATDAVTAEDVAAVVAACGDRELTNGRLSFYYWQQFYQFMSVYGSYISMMGLDLSQPLSEQMYDETHTWEDLFLRMAMTAFWQDCAVQTHAQQAGFQADASVETDVESLLKSLEDTASVSNFDSADAYLQSLYGPFVTAADYADYARVSMANDDYLTELFDGIKYSEADVEAYFDAHAEDFTSQGLSKDDPNMINVRHILITPKADEGAETDENGSPVLTDQNWADAQAKAEELLAQWQAGEATEDSFAALSTEHNEDPGSASTGGLYTEVAPGRMVETFNDWCFDAARQPGDTGIVKTDYGYHVMYFVGQCDHAAWYNSAEQQYVSVRKQTMVQEMLDATDITVDYDKVVLMENTALQGGQ